MMSEADEFGTLQWCHVPPHVVLPNDWAVFDAAFDRIVTVWRQTRRINPDASAWLWFQLTWLGDETVRP